MRVINIYTSSLRLVEILKEIPPLSGYSYRFSTRLEPLNPKQVNLIITARLPGVLAEGAKYILCSRKPQTISSEALSKIYDLWPMPLTPSLIDFHFQKVMTRIRFELENASGLKEHQKRILEMARQDYLTGLATRWYLQDFIERNRHERNITCIYFDLDNFKSINDTFGHQAGDRALAATAEMMQNVFTDGFASRMGGDEFMLVLLGRRDISVVEYRVNDFMSKLLSYYGCTAAMKALSVSAGISQSVPGAEKSIDQLIHEADRALYEAKKRGKAMCKIYEPSMN